MWLILVFPFLIFYLGHIPDRYFSLVEISLNLVSILFIAWGIFELRPESKLPPDQPGKTDFQRLRLLAGLECLRTGAFVSWICMIMTIASEPVFAGDEISNLYVPLLGIALPFVLLLIFEAIIRFRLKKIEVEFPDSIWRRGFCILSAFMLILIGAHDTTGDSWGIFAIAGIITVMISLFISGFRFFRQGRKA